MKKIFDIYKEYIPIILLVFYLFGFVYSIGFYNQFGIAIENYITLTDVIFVAVVALFKLAMAFAIAELILVSISCFILMVINLVVKRGKERWQIMNAVVNSEIKVSEISVFLLSIAVIVYLSTEIVYGQSLNLVVLWFTIPFMILKIKQISDIGKRGGRKWWQFLGRYSARFVLIVAIGLFLWGSIKGSSCKNERQTSQMEFTENGTTYNTITDSLTFIGETSQYLFVYEPKSGNTLVVNKLKISNYKVKHVIKGLNFFDLDKLIRSK